MQIADVMTRGVECVRPDDTIEEAARRMKELDVGSLPVCGDDHLLGMITDRDITIRSIADGSDPALTTVRDVMTPKVIWCFEDQDLTEAAQLMEDNQIRRLPVLSRNKRLIGMLSLGDLALRGDDEMLSAEALERVSEPAGV
jgi:CBS domain-containing protein